MTCNGGCWITYTHTQITYITLRYVCMHACIPKNTFTLAHSSSNKIYEQTITWVRGNVCVCIAMLTQSSLSHSIRLLFMAFSVRGYDLVVCMRAYMHACMSLCACVRVCNTIVNVHGHSTKCPDSRMLHLSFSLSLYAPARCYISLFSHKFSATSQNCPIFGYFRLNFFLWSFNGQHRE